MSKPTLSITFVLPGMGMDPSGGPKVVYEYANGLVQRGHRVRIVHTAVLGTEQHSALRRARSRLGYIRTALNKRYRPDAWFQVDPRVHLLWTPTLQDRHIPDGDIVVATWLHTAEWVAQYPPTKGKKFYLLQHFETWGGPEEQVLATWRLPLHKIVIARWLKDIADSIGQKSTYIPNGLDFKTFGLDIPPDVRTPGRVMMLYHAEPWKGSADGLSALSLARQQVPTLEADLFGVPEAPKNLPHWIRYHRKPSQQALRHLYNQAAIFLAPSWAEGWGLPPSEAMQCGCAVLATDIGGHREFCTAGETALLCPPKDPAAMAAQLVRLLQDPALRTALARTGNANIQQFSWDRSVDAFEAALYVA